MIRLGLDTWLWADQFTERHLFCIEEAHRLGAEVIDFSINVPELFPKEKAASLIKQFGMEAVVTTAMPQECNPISPDPNVRIKALDFMKKLLEIAGILDAKIVGGVNYTASGYLTGKCRTREELDWVADYLRKAAEEAAKQNITIAIEPVKRFESHLINTAEQALELIRITDTTNVKVHLDTFHMNIEEKSLPEAVLLCGDQLAYMHLVDSNRGVPGMGHIPWLDLWKALKTIGFNGPACIETFNPETLEETCKMTFLTRRFGKSAAELAQKGLRYLRAVEILTENG